MKHRTVKHTLNAQISAEVGLDHVDMFDLYVHIIDLTVRLLGTREFASRAQKGRRVIRKKLSRISKVLPHGFSQVNKTKKKTYSDIGEFIT